MITESSASSTNQSGKESSAGKWIWQTKVRTPQSPREGTLARGRLLAGKVEHSISHPALETLVSMYCLNSSVSSFITEVATRSSALSCSMRAFSRSEFCCALRKAVSSVTRAGMVSMTSCRTRAASSQSMSPKRSLKASRMFDSRSSSGSVRRPRRRPAAGSAASPASRPGSCLCR